MEPRSPATRTADTLFVICVTPYLAMSEFHHVAALEPRTARMGNRPENRGRRVDPFRMYFGNSLPLPTQAVWRMARHSLADGAGNLLGYTAEGGWPSRAVSRILPGTPL